MTSTQFHPHYPPYQYQSAQSSYQTAAPASASFSDMYSALNQTKTDIKKLRGWHGSRLAVAGGVAGGVAVVSGVGVATFFTGGAAAIGVAAAAGGVGVAVGGGMAGMAKTWFGKRQCKKNEQLMEKVVLLTQLQQELKAQKPSLGPAQRQLYRDVKKVTRKVDRGSLKEAVAMAGRTAAGVAGGAASVVIVGLLVAAAGGGGGGGDGCFCWGPSPTIGVNAGFSGGGTHLGNGSPQDSGVILSRDQLSMLQTPLR